MSTETITPGITTTRHGSQPSDGGASSALAYGGEITTKNCSQNPTIGRLLPNAFMVRSKKEME